MELTLREVGEMIIFVAAVVGGLGMIYRYLMQPGLTRVVRDIVAEEVRPVKTEIETVKSEVSFIKNEVSLNHGKSLKDTVVRLEKKFDAHTESTR